MKHLLAIILLAALPALILGQPCPLGVQNDPHPGQCGAYGDANRDSICDLSQAEGPVADQARQGLPAQPAQHAWQIFLSVAVMAVATELLTLREKGLNLRLQAVWNWLLTVAFLLSSATGLYFVLPTGWRPTLGPGLLYWHTETGLAFIAIGLYHVARRLGCMFRGLAAFFVRR